MQNTTIVATTTATTTLSISILWNDPAFLILATISGSIGFWNAFVFISKNQIKLKSIDGLDIIANATFVGAVFAPIINFALILFGEFFLKDRLGIEFTQSQQLTLYALYWFTSLFSGRKLGEYAMDRLKNLKKKKKREENE